MREEHARCSAAAREQQTVVKEMQVLQQETEKGALRRQPCAIFFSRLLCMALVLRWCTTAMSAALGLQYASRFFVAVLRESESAHLQERASLQAVSV